MITTTIATQQPVARDLRFLLSLDHATYELEAIQDIFRLMTAETASVERGTRILFAAHYLERIGDRVTNIAGDVVFLATGDIEDLNP